MSAKIHSVKPDVGMTACLPAEAAAKGKELGFGA